MPFWQKFIEESMRINEPVSQTEYQIEAGQALMSVTDVQGRITYCNRAFALASGFQEQELLGQPHNLVRHPDMPAECFRDMWHTLKSGHPWSGMVKNRRKNGDFYWVWANVTPVYGERGLVGFMSVRSAPSREAVQQASAWYERLQQQAREGGRRHAVSQGQVVLAHAPARLWRKLGQGLWPVWLLGAGVCSLALLAVWAGRTLPAWQALGLVAVASGACVLALHRTVVPWLQLVSTIHRLAAGDLSEAVPLTGRGALREAQQGLSQVMMNLRTVVHDTRSEITSLTGAIGEIAAGNQELSSRTEAQASNLEETAASIEQISGTAKKTADVAEQASSLSQEMVGVTQRSCEAVESARVAVASIDEASGKMQDIVRTIESVAFQTNILALNAAVEAARAGEHGRGFAVVAAEVRSLATRTANAVVEIKDLIQNSIQRVAVGNKQAAQAEQCMREATHSVALVTTLLGDIAVAASEQQKGVAQISEALALMDTITQQNAGMVQELAASTWTLSTQVKQATSTMDLLKLHAHERSLAERDAVGLRRTHKA